MKRPVDAAERRSNQQDLVRRPGLDRRADAIAPAAGLRRNGEVGDAIAAALVRRRNRDRLRETRRRRRLFFPKLEDGLTHEYLAGERSDLDVVDPRRSAERPRATTAAAPAATAEHGVFDSGMRGLQRAVGPAQQERTQRRVRRDVGDREPERREHDHSEHEASAQRFRPGHYSGSASSMYPA